MDKVEQIKQKIAKEPNVGLFNYKGFDCVVLRNNDKVLCGYLSFEPGHKLYGYTEEKMTDLYPDLPFHYGVDYADKGSYLALLPMITDNWYIGFDCEHTHDYIPAFEERNGSFEYRDYAYVTQCLKDSVDYLISKGVQGNGAN